MSWFKEVTDRIIAELKKGIILWQKPWIAAGQMNVSELARVCGLSRPTVYKYLRMVG